MPERKPARSFTWPIILITIGIVWLMSNLNLIDVRGWDLILDLWPLLLIVLGIDSLIRERGLAGPVFLIGIGIIFILSNFEVISWDVWFLVLRLWPLILVAIGLDIIIGRRSVWLSALALVFVLAILAGSLVFSGSFSSEGLLTGGTGQPLEGEMISAELVGVDRAQLSLNPAIASLRIDASDSDANLIEGMIRMARNETVVQDFDISDGLARYSLRSKSPGSFIDGFTNGLPRRRWDLEINPDIPMELDFNLGVGESEIDLRESHLVDLQVSIGIGQIVVFLPEGDDYSAVIDGGIGQTIIHFPDSGSFRIEVSGGIGEIVLRIPRDLGVRVKVDRGIAGLQVPDSFIQSGGYYLSPSHESSGDFVEVFVEMGIGNIAIRYE